MTRQPDPPRANSRYPALAAIIGVAAAAILVPTVSQWEGRELRAYRDVVGVLTICDGDTNNVRPGQVATEAECDARLERQLIAHATPILEGFGGKPCAPSLKDKPNALAASASLAYNIGVASYCRSTAARRFRAGDIAGGCDAFLMWRFAGGREIRGLLNRRKAERTICLRDAA
jgi:lysozyme